MRLMIEPRAIERGRDITEAASPRRARLLLMVRRREPHDQQVAWRVDDDAGSREQRWTRHIALERAAARVGTPPVQAARVVRDLYSH